MKNLSMGIVLGLAAIGLFGVSVIAFLSLSGRMTDEGLRSLPVVGAYLPEKEPPLPGPGQIFGIEEASARKQGKKKGKKLSREEQANRRKIFTLEAFDAPTSRQEIQEFFSLTKAGYERLKKDRAAFEREQYELTLREADLEERRLTLDKLMKEIETEKRRLETRFEEFRKAVIEMAKEELKNLKKTSEVLAGMEPVKAAERLEEIASEDEGLAVKILVNMESSAASEILSSMDSERSANLIKKTIKVIKN